MGAEVIGKTVAAAAFQANCLRIINEMGEDSEPVTITRRGRPVAVLAPVRPEGEDRSIIGAMKGTVLAYDDLFLPAVDPADGGAPR